MSDDPIKAALAEAARAITDREDALGIAPAVSGTDAEMVADAAIAAFLRAMPWMHYEPEALGFGENMTGEELAAAVERAAEAPDA